MNLTDVQWTKDDAVFARGIFQSATWQKMIEIQKLAGPRMNYSSMEQLAFSGLRKDVWEKCLNSFANFAEDVLEEESFEQIDISNLDSRRRYAQEETARVTHSQVPPPNGNKT